jgi:ABC-type sugar transport system ATPase subunit
MNFLSGDAVPGKRKVNEKTLGVRPEHLTIGGKEAIKFSGTVDLVERLGDIGYAYVTLVSGHAITAEVRGEIGLEPGKKATFSADPRHVHWFDGDGQRLAA